MNVNIHTPLTMQQVNIGNAHCDQDWTGTKCSQHRDMCAPVSEVAVNTLALTLTLTNRQHAFHRPHRALRATTHIHIIFYLVLNWHLLTQHVELWNTQLRLLVHWKRSKPREHNDS